MRLAVCLLQYFFLITEFMHDFWKIWALSLVCKLDCKGHWCSHKGTVGAYNGTSWTWKSYSYFQYGSYFWTFKASRASTHNNRGGQSHIEQCSKNRRVLDCRKFNIKNIKSGTLHPSSYLTSDVHLSFAYFVPFLNTSCSLTSVMFFLGESTGYRCCSGNPRASSSVTGHLCHNTAWSGQSINFSNISSRYSGHIFVEIKLNFAA